MQNRTTTKFILLSWLLLTFFACVPQPQAVPLSNYLTQTEALIAKRSYGEAITLLEDAAAAHPDKIAPLLKLGQIYLAQHRWLLAEDAFNRALARQPRSPAALTGLAEALLQQGQLYKSLQFWQEATTIDPQLPGGFTGLGRTQLALFDFQAAQTAFEQQPSNPEAQWYLAALTAPYNPSAAIEILKAISPAPPSSGQPEAEAIRASLLARRDYLQKTLAPFKTESPPAAAAKATGIALAQIQLWPLAVHALSTANELNPGDAETLAFWGYAQAEAGQPRPALFAEARRADPKSALPLYFEGIYLRQQGELQAANDLFNQAITLDPDNAAIYAELAGTLAEQGFPAAAEAGYKVAVEISENEMQFRLLLARFYLSQNYRLNEAGIPLLKELIELDQNNAQAYELLGPVQFFAGAPDGGEAALRRTLELNPNSISARYYLARLYENNRQFSSARVEYQRVIDWDTSGAYRDKALKDLQRLNVQR